MKIDKKWINSQTIASIAAISQEIFTDPSYYGQIMVTTNAHIGNYGYSNNEIESDSVKISGLVCKDFNFHNSRYSSVGDLETYFNNEKIVAIYDVDTRALVTHIRDKGAMNAVISTISLDVESLKMRLSKVPPMEGLELSSFVLTIFFLKNLLYINDSL